MLNIGWFSTGRSESSLKLFTWTLQQIKKQHLPIKIAFVFCNRVQGEHVGTDNFLSAVTKCKIPLITTSYQRNKSLHGKNQRELFDKEIYNKIKNFNTDICMLAGYRLILSEYLTKKFIFLNLHPALPDGPIGTWENVISTLIENQIKTTGAMIHIVTKNLDRGPVVSFHKIALTGRKFDALWKRINKSKSEKIKLFNLIRNEGFLKEPFLILESLKQIGEKKIKIANNQIYHLGNPIIGGICLNKEIELSFNKLNKNQ